MNLSYQNQDCDLTLEEGIEEYRGYLIEIGREVMSEVCDSSTLILEHDATHVIFGLDTSLEQEALLDTWVLFGCSWKLGYIFEYGRLPDVKRLSKALYKELGVLGFLRLYFHVLTRKLRVLRKCWHMSKKWPFRFPKQLLTRKISSLRAEYGIAILSSQERSRPLEIDWSGEY